MKITLYNTKSEKERLNKTLKELLTINDAKITTSFDLLKATIILKRDIIENVKDINYVYIDKFKRFYFCEVSIENGFIVLSCDVDALMSYKNEILKIVATIDRNEFLRNGYIQDDSYKVLAYEEVVCKSFPSGLTSDSLILMTVG